MASFEYQAYDAVGKLRKGLIEADSPRLARQALRARGLFPLRIETGRAKNKERNSDLLVRLFHRKLPPADLILMTRQLATLTGSGMPLERSLNMIAEQADSRMLRRVVTAVRTDVSEGIAFSQALRRLPQKLPDEYIAAINAGEESGDMAKILERLAEDIEELDRTRQTLTSAMVYPAVMLFVSVGIIILLMVYVVPQVTEVFASQKQELPFMTKTLIAVSAFLRAYSSVLLLLIAAAVFGFSYALRQKEFRYRYDRFLVRLPLLGSWITMSTVGRWSRSLGVLLAGGVPGLRSLQIAARSVGNTYLRQHMEDANRHVSEGMSINKALAKCGVFPGFLIYMISSGEQSGNLDGMLIKCSEYYGQRLKTVTQSALRIFEPMLILFMGMMVLMIILAILLPIFQINQLVF